MTHDQVSLVIWAVQFGRQCYQALRNCGEANTPTDKQVFGTLNRLDKDLSLTLGMVQ